MFEESCKYVGNYVVVLAMDWSQVPNTRQNRLRGTWLYSLTTNVMTRYYPIRGKSSDRVWGEVSL